MRLPWLRWAGRTLGRKAGGWSTDTFELLARQPAVNMDEPQMPAIVENEFFGPASDVQPPANSGLAQRWWLGA
jgi:hypothetical protein